MRTIYRAWVNQPSTQQPLHHMHGEHCIAQDDGQPTVRLWFTEGSIHSMQAPRECISRLNLSAAQD